MKQNLKFFSEIFSGLILFGPVNRSVNRRPWPILGLRHAFIVLMDFSCSCKRAFWPCERMCGMFTKKKNQFATSKVNFTIFAS